MNKAEVQKTPDHIDVGVIGAGVIGLAVARELALEGRRVFVFESESGIATHTSSRNSEVIHSGIYYKTPLKSALCTKGKRTLYEYCQDNQIPHKKVGKLLIATDEDEMISLERLMEQGIANGVNDLERLDERDIADLEPQVSAVGGIFSPSSGVIASHALINSLRSDLLNSNGQIMTSTKVRAGRVEDGGIALELDDADQSVALCAVVINAAGLFASRVAQTIEGLPKEQIPETYFAKGHYFTVAGAPFNHHIYPMPAGGGLGIHVTVDIEGNVKFGPDVVWTDDIDYSFTPGRRQVFFEAISRYYPSIKQSSLKHGYTGIRPKIVPQGAPDGDFGIVGPGDHGVPGLVNLFGIESPGLTSALAVAEHVAGLI